jgi:hypothetical protein
MRDLESISIALTAAETGHLVFSTLHTQTAPATINRIVDVFNDTERKQIRQQLSTTLQAVVSQQLLPKIGGGKTVAIEYMVGTMIEIPRAALTADKIAEVAEFFSFGTNDLTQMGFGYSRDDAGKFLPIYIEKGILKNDPFIADPSVINHITSFLKGIKSKALSLTAT